MRTTVYFAAFTAPTIDPALTTLSFGSPLARYGDGNDDRDDAAYAVSLRPRHQPERR